VDCKIEDIYSEHKGKFDKTRKEKEYKEKILFNLLLELNNEQTIIYCSSPARVRELSTKFCNYLVEQNIKPQTEELSIIEWIRNNVSDKWGNS
jgi:superfamily II DNA or RNA helicase